MVLYLGSIPQSYSVLLGVSWVECEGSCLLAAMVLVKTEISTERRISCLYFYTSSAITVVKQPKQYVVLYSLYSYILY